MPPKPSAISLKNKPIKATGSPQGEPVFFRPFRLREGTETLPYFPICSVVLVGAGVPARPLWFDLPMRWGFFASSFRFLHRLRAVNDRPYKF